ncbi:MAG: hypothetical protein GY768_20785 [Planctomycetaceae bacterium]|nr:hypothetical protein [Planctomycetaceae bacterium]
MFEQIDISLHHVYVINALLSCKLEDGQLLLSAETQADAMKLTHGFLSHEMKFLAVRRPTAVQG